jgi:phage FluMu protein Com
MPTEFQCTQCGRALEAGDASPGTRILCPGCGAFSTVPGPAPGAPIEFRCTGCNKLLRTAAETAGKQAKCPECGTVTSVPAAGTMPAKPEPFIPPPPPGAEQPGPFALGGDPENPYMAPTQAGQPPPFAGGYVPAADRVSGPAIGLIVTGALGLVGQALGLVLNVVGIGMGAVDGGQDALPAMFSGGFGIVTGMIGIVAGVVVIMGALKMKNLESYGFSMAAAIIAMVPCISPCCWLGLPFGIWALVVLSDAGVKASFRS